MGKKAIEQGKKKLRKERRKKRLQKRVEKQIKKQEKTVAKRQAKILKSAEKIAKKAEEEIEDIEEDIEKRKEKGKKTKSLERKQKKLLAQMEKIINRKLERASTVKQRMDKRREAMRKAASLGKAGLVFVANHPVMMKNIIEVGGDIAATLLIIVGTALTEGIATAPLISAVAGIRTAQTGLKKGVDLLIPVGTAIQGADQLKASFKEGASFIDLMKEGASAVDKVAKVSNSDVINDLNNKIQSSMNQINKYKERAEKVAEGLEKAGIKIPDLPSNLNKSPLVDEPNRPNTIGIDLTESVVIKKPKKKKKKKAPKLPPNLDTSPMTPASKKKKSKRKPSAYNKHMSEHMKAGGSFKSGVDAWNAKKKSSKTFNKLKKELTDIINNTQRTGDEARKDGEKYIENNMGSINKLSASERKKILFMIEF